jgi:hypothetical protein
LCQTHPTDGRVSMGVRMIVWSKRMSGLLLAAAVAMPVSVIALPGAPAWASAGTPDPPVTCGVSGSMLFDLGHPAAGISTNGFAGAATLDRITVPSVPGCSGDGGINYFEQGVKCDKKVAGSPASNPACQPGLSWADVLGNVPPPATHGRIGGSFASAIRVGTKGIFDAWRYLLNGKSYVARSATVALVPAGSSCGSSEIGFQAVGHVNSPRWDKSEVMTLTLCLGAIAGTGLNPGDNFYDASIDQVGIVDSAVIDSAASTVHIG